MRIGVFSCLAILLTSPAAAQFDPKYVANEVAMLPDYCHDFLGGESRRISGLAKWGTLMGETAHHMHHYCRGLLAMNRAQRLKSFSEQQRQSYWGNAVSEISYVILRAPPDFVLLPEALYKRAIGLSMLGKVNEAVVDFKESMRLKPSYYVAYAGLADLYRRHKRYDLAKETVAEGLRHSPGAQMLRKLREELEKSGQGEGAHTQRESRVPSTPSAQTEDQSEHATKPDPASPPTEQGSAESGVN